MQKEIKQMKRIITIVLLLIVSCSKQGNEYKYVVGGSSGDYFVTIQNADNNLQQYGNVPNDFSYSWTQTGERWLYVSAQNNTASGYVTVSIYKNGKRIATNTSSGGYTIATVSGNY